MDTLDICNDFMPLEDLADALNISVRNLREDLDELSSLSDILRVTFLKNKVKLEFHQNTGIESITQYLISHNISYKIIETLFYNETMHLDELAGSMYISSSTLYRQFRKIGNVLKKNFNIDIESNPCRLTGSEEDIRSFYVTFFSEKHSIFEWPFKSIVSEDIFEECVVKIIDIIGISVDFSFIRYVKYVGAVGLARYKNGHVLS